MGTCVNHDWAEMAQVHPMKGIRALWKMADSSVATGKNKMNLEPLCDVRRSPQNNGDMSKGTGANLKGLPVATYGTI